MIRHDQPWVHHTSADALGEPRCRELLALFDGVETWEQHRTFYEAAIAVVTPRIDPAWLSGLRDRVAALTGEPLSDTVRVTLQTMAPGQFARVHSDRPLLGFETLRLVVQLTLGWALGDGGEFCVHATADGPARSCYPPAWGSGVLFSLHPGSLHAVPPTRIERRTVVFHFHHVGNSPALADAVGVLFAHLSFMELPQSLDAAIARAETEHPEERSLRALTLATALQRWGWGDEEIARGLATGLGPDALGHGSTPILLAAWATRLHHDDMDPRLWARLDGLLRTRAPVEGPAQDFRALAFPAR